ncbi:unnamed protein product [Trifolium pratense]|uniref:Uncharacterized protein n=1 Tax=Trifolium pratense TaxID=57577 RepID=A0ACB0ISG3_TRIPR|nr:unnamed protein product [Trifolium pratense]
MQSASKRSLQDTVVVHALIATAFSSVEQYVSDQAYSAFDRSRKIKLEFN